MKQKDFAHLKQHQMEEDLIIDVKAMIQDTEENGLLIPECCIYKVPPEICFLKEDAYTPIIISIGPLHYRNVKLQNMESHKKIFFKTFTQKALIGLDDMVSFVKHSVPKVRVSCSENINLSDKELVKLLLVDVGFIIELFWRNYKTEGIRDDAKLSQPWLQDILLTDLILLENQLPFFFIEGLFNISFPLGLWGDLPSFLELTYEYFQHFNIQDLQPDPSVRIKHFTDLLRLFHLFIDDTTSAAFSISERHPLFLAIFQPATWSYESEDRLCNCCTATH